MISRIRENGRKAEFRQRPAFVALHFTVVPANAGTHNPREQLLKESRPPLCRNNIRRGVWVPAFAGTTEELPRVRL